jgi:hypothetical protein
MFLLTNFVAKLHQVTERYLPNKPVYLLLDLTGKIGSEHWVSSLLWKDHLSKNCQGIVWPGCKTHLNPEFPVATVDDCAYAGINTCSRFDEFVYALPDEKMSNPRLALCAFAVKGADVQAKHRFGITFHAAEWVDPAFEAE